MLQYLNLDSFSNNFLFNIISHGLILIYVLLEPNIVTKKKFNIKFDDFYQLNYDI